MYKPHLLLPQVAFSSATGSSLISNSMIKIPYLSNIVTPSFPFTLSFLGVWIWFIHSNCCIYSQKLRNYTVCMCVNYFQPPKLMSCNSVLVLLWRPLAFLTSKFTFFLSPLLISFQCFLQQSSLIIFSLIQIFLVDGQESELSFRISKPFVCHV